MNKDKQIKEIAKVIKSSLDGLGSGNFNFTGDEISTIFAEALYNADYRKIDEFLDEIYNVLKSTLDYIPFSVIECLRKYEGKVK